MLRASTADQDASLRAITEGAAGDDGNIPHAATLLAFAEGIHGYDAAKTETACATLLSTLGEAATVDSAAVCAQFNAITRVADSTGIQLDAMVERGSAGIRDDLGLNAFNTTVE